MNVNDDNAILEVKDLSVSFDGRTVVRDVSYTLQRGRTLGIVGESGSGKSVSTMALMGLLPKNADVTGEARLKMRNENQNENENENREGIRASKSTKSTGASVVTTMPAINLLSLDEEGFRAVRGQRISMIFQEPMTSLNPVQKCGEQVMEMLRAENGKRSRVNNATYGTENGVPKAANTNEKNNISEQRETVLELFREVMLPRPEKIFDSYPHEISGGQKQRVMIAMALICNPDIIIADEPTTALDVTVQKTILDLLRNLQRKHGMSIIFITHDLGVIAQIADDIAVMYHGEIVEMGTADEIIHRPQHPYTKGLLACRPPLQGRPRRLRTVEEFIRNEDENENPNRKQAACVPGEAASKAACVPGEPLLSVRNLNVTYTLERNFWGKPKKQLKAVDGMTFDVYRGETLGLVGESGCGKTTLGRAVMRLIESQSESITFDGKRIDTLSSREMRRLRQKIQIIFQDPYSSLNPRLTVGQAIMEPLQVWGTGNGVALTTRHTERGTENGERGTEIGKRQRVMELMERVGLSPEWFDRYPHEFSGGQRQRICIARALILNPELVICDESVSALDVSVQAQVLNLLNELKEQFGYTYIFISHDLSVVHFISDRIMVMRQGRMVELADSDTLFNSPGDDYTRMLLDAIPRI